MKLYKIKYTEIVTYVGEIEANSADEANTLLLNGECPNITASDSQFDRVISIKEIENV